MKLFFSLTLVLFYSSLFSQNHTIHGYIKDKETGEALIGANVILKDQAVGTVTNPYGFYSLSLKPGSYEIEFSYVGYELITKEIMLSEDVEITLELAPSTQNIDEVVVSAKAKNQKVISTQMGVEKLTGKTIQKIPVLLGEADVIKALKLLPGIVATSETSSSLSIRGGARDQNMIQLDEATVYNASHLLGLFSVFNNDAIKNVEMYKGMIPAQYGGRISSVIDIRMKEGNTKKFSAVGSIGLITSKLTLEIPVVKNKSSLLISGRRTYIDLLTKGFSKANDKAVEIPYYFYDFNIKGNYTISPKHRIYLSGYFGKDVSRSEISEENTQKMEWGNYTSTLRWNYTISNRLFVNTSLLASNYNYALGSKSTFGKEKKTQTFNWDAQLRDYSLKLDFNYYLNPKNSIKFGASSIYHNFSVGKVTGNMDTIKFNYKLPDYNSLEHAAYINNIQKINKVISVEYGLRASLFQNIGEGTSYKLDNYEVIDTLTYKRNEIYNNYYGLEPRIFSTFIINSANSIKVGYSRTIQYVHIASNSSSGTPLDVWMPATPNTKPQYANQWAAGYFRNLFDNKFETSVEVYYKQMNNQVEFREFSTPYFNKQIESDFRFGKGRAYGVEFLVRKNEGKITGWVSYTLAKSEKKTKDIQEKGWYPSPYDHRHNLSTVVMYDITKRISVSTNWVFLSGKPFDAPSARFEYGNLVLPYYEGKNGSRTPDYHRLDFSVEIKGKPRKHFNSSWVFSVYNAYNRRNSNLVYFEAENNTTKAYNYSLLQRIYSVSYNFNF